MSSSISSSNSNNNPHEVIADHDIFLSFRSEDTRSGFTSFLYDALVREGIKTFFRDDKSARGKAISGEIQKAIQGSRSSVLVLSENYALSSWCLTELCKIVECMDTSGLVVLPIFYHVDPSHVRKQKGSYRDAFEKHENNRELRFEEMKSWKDALTRVANIAGWTLQEKDNEAKFIKNFTAYILERRKSGDIGSNIFGKAITDSTLQAMPEYKGKEITATDRSHEALKLINADNKVDTARTFLKNLKSRYSDGVCTQCLIYNSTGGTLEHAGNLNWFGHVVGESPYPNKIENGQWVAFLHVHDYDPTSGSIAATVYRGKNTNGTVCEWMLSWYNSCDNKKVYTEVLENNHFGQNHWDTIYDLLENKGLKNTNTWNGCVSAVTITGDSSCAIFEGVMKLVNA